MAYTPPPLVPSAPVPGVLTGETSGTITTFDYSLHLNAIIKELNQLNYNLSAISTAEPGSVMAQMSLTNTNLKDTLSQYTKMTDTFRDLTGAITSMNKTMTTSNTGLANIATTMTKQLIVTETATMDQIKNNQLTQAIAKQAQIDAGKEPVVISPEAFLTRVETAVNDVLEFRAISFAVGVVTQAINDTITTAYTTSVTWAGQTAAGQWITTTYLETELFITKIFNPEKAKQLATELANRAKNATKNPGGVSS
jgi:ArsR family metal-binding transcriptional regulator